MLYKEKNYEVECDFLEEIFHRHNKNGIKHILDMGCGTGGHAISLARCGYKVHGIDRSPEMVTIAKEKAEAQGLSDRVWFETGNIQDINIKNKFDAVICMFAVIGYQISNDELFAALQNVRKHLKPKGLFVCDFWYGPAVLKQRPTDRIKIVQNENGDRIIRLAKPEIDIQKNCVTVFYHLLHFQGNQLVNEMRESHEVRYLFQPEIAFFIEQSGMNLIRVCPFAELDLDPSEETWNVSAIAKALK